MCISISNAIGIVGRVSMVWHVSNTAYLWGGFKWSYDCEEIRMPSDELVSAVGRSKTSVCEQFPQSVAVVNLWIQSIWCHIAGIMQQLWYFFCKISEHFKSFGDAMLALAQLYFFVFLVWRIWEKFFFEQSKWREMPVSFDLTGLIFSYHLVCWILFVSVHLGQISPSWYCFICNVRSKILERCPSSKC